MADPTLDQALAVVADPAAQPAAIPDSIATITGDRPVLRIDITDPPSLPVAIVGDIQATGASADAAMIALATVVSADQTAQAAPAAPVTQGQVTP